jgi:hypothetical protein
VVSVEVVVAARSLDSRQGLETPNSLTNACLTRNSLQTACHSLHPAGQRPRPPKTVFGGEKQSSMQQPQTATGILLARLIMARASLPNKHSQEGRGTQRRPSRRMQARCRTNIAKRDAARNDVPQGARKPGAQPPYKQSMQPNKQSRNKHSQEGRGTQRRPSRRMQAR